MKNAAVLSNAVDYDSEVIIKGFDINGKAIAAAMATLWRQVEEDISFSRSANSEQMNQTESSLQNPSVW